MTGIDQSSRRIGRSIVAIVVGFLVVVALSVGTDMIFHATKVGAIAMRGFAPDWYPWTLAATVLPTAWIGGRLYIRSKT